MVTISGGVIENLKESSISFRLKCELCGVVESSETKISITKGITDIFQKKCPSCGSNQIIKIKC